MNVIPLSLSLCVRRAVGTGTTAYLYMIWILGWGFLLAAVVSIPQIYWNQSGRRLVDMGYAHRDVERLTPAGRPWDIWLPATRAQGSVLPMRR